MRRSDRYVSNACLSVTASLSVRLSCAMRPSTNGPHRASESSLCHLRRDSSWVLEEARGEGSEHQAADMRHVGHAPGLGSRGDLTETDELEHKPDADEQCSRD